MSVAALRFTEVTKRYGASVLAVDRLSFEVPRGVIAGFVGPNGAGKTTTFSIVSGLLLPDAGIVDILGRGPFQPGLAKGVLGVLPQDAALPERHTPWELLVHLGRLQGLRAPEARTEAERLLDVVSLTDRARARIGALSHGMRRRVAVATALCGSPELVLLDEPLAGLDPVQAHSLREALIRLRGIQTLVVSSHNLAEVERMSDWVVVLRRGQCVRQGPLAAVTGQGEVVRWHLGPGELDLAALRSELPGWRLSVEGSVLVQQALEPASAEAIDAASLVLMRRLVERGVAVRQVSRGDALERRFIEDATS